MGESRSANLDQQKSKIMGFLKSQGPSIPIKISNYLELDSLLTNAFLSELISEKQIRLSSMRVGNSPIYYILGQERQLEDFSHYLSGKVKEAFSLLKGEGILLDQKQSPAIRVALRSLKDFSFPFQFKGSLFWRYFVLNERQAVELVKKRSSRGALVIDKKPEVKKPETIVNPVHTLVEPVNTVIEIKNKIVKPRDKGKSDFVNDVEVLLANNNLTVSEEIGVKKKEYNAKIKVNSQIGDIEFLCIAKDKKTVTENDLKLASQESNSRKMPVLLISPGSLNKKASQKLEEMNNLIFFKRLE